MNGELEQTGGRWRLRFTRRLAHPPHKVWGAITEPEQLAAWFPQRVAGEWEVGAPLRFEYGSETISGFDGEVLAVREPSLLEFRWGTDVIRLEIAEADGGCTLTLTDTIDELGKAARDAAGWHVCLDRLEGALDGAPRESQWAPLNERYAEKFGPDASTIGPPAGHPAAR
jgi:uncharacterized protein YndB with AHSA1/START domain